MKRPPEPADLGDRAHALEAILDLARWLMAAGWQMNVAFENGAAHDAFTLSGAREG